MIGFWKRWFERNAKPKITDDELNSIKNTAQRLIDINEAEEACDYLLRKLGQIPFIKGLEKIQSASINLDQNKGSPTYNQLKEELRGSITAIEAQNYFTHLIERIRKWFRRWRNTLNRWLLTTFVLMLIMRLSPLLFGQYTEDAFLRLGTLTYTIVNTHFIYYFTYKIGDKKHENVEFHLTYDGDKNIFETVQDSCIIQAILGRVPQKQRRVRSLNRFENTVCALYLPSLEKEAIYGFITKLKNHIDIEDFDKKGLSIKIKGGENEIYTRQFGFTDIFVTKTSKYFLDFFIISIIVILFIVNRSSFFTRLNLN